MNAKTCKQCGELKPISQYRKYYGGRKGSYTICKACEKINSRAKYLTNKGERMNYEEEAELDQIHALWDAQREAGLLPPRIGGGRSVPLTDNLDEMILKYKATQRAVATEPTAYTWVPNELSKWLVCELTLEPDEYLDGTYEQLKEKFRPVLRIDPATMLPVYDDTYKDVLDKILERFNAYEDEYYSKE